MLPCNLIVQELHHNEIQVVAINPVTSMQVIENPELIQIAKLIQEMLAKLVKGLK